MEKQTLTLEVTTEEAAEVEKLIKQIRLEKLDEEKKNISCLSLNDIGLCSRDDPRGMDIITISRSKLGEIWKQRVNELTKKA